MNFDVIFSESSRTISPSFTEAQTSSDVDFSENNETLQTTFSENGMISEVVGFDETDQRMLVEFGEIQIAGGTGIPGKDGLSAYEVAVKNGFVGSEKEWLASLEGEPGRDGSDGEPGKDGTPGEDGKSAYQYAQEGGYTGTEADFYEDLSSVGSGGGSTDLTGYATEVWVQEGYQPKGDYLTDSKLSTAINSALAQAKESGEFDGKDGVDGLPGKDGDPGLPGNDGTPGADGVTPHIGDNGNWFIGATDTGIPATGPAGADGAPGEAGQDGSDGADGVSPSVSVSAITGGNRVSITDVYGIKTFDVMDGIDGTDGSDGQDGSPGQDGVSATHSWDGTVLTITSASGTSSADLKGEPGEPGSDGQDGADGKPGADGYTPQRGKDYWTTADVQVMVAEAVAEVMKAIAPSKVDFSNGKFFAPATNVLYKPSTILDTGITFQYKGGSGVEELYFPITGLYQGRTYTIAFDETYNGGYIQDTYRYGCGIIQKAEYDSMTKPTSQAKPSWVAWHTGSTGKQSGSITFTANADTVYWAWSLGRLSDGKEVTISMNARVF